MRYIVFGLVLVLFDLVATAAQIITLEEHLGYAWQADLVHRPVTVATPGTLFPDRLALYNGNNAVPVQLENLQTYPDGSVKSADVWFRTDLPAHATRTFTLRSVTKGFVAPKTDLAVTKDGNTLVFSNGVTAARIPAGTWEPSATATLAEYLHVPASAEKIPGPLLGVKMASGAWTAASSITPAGPLRKVATDLLDAGPILVRARITYTFADGGTYTMIVLVRANEPLVRINERYEKAGTLVLDLGTGLQPTQFATKADFRGNMQRTTISYEKPNKLPGLVGWDFYLPDLTSVIGYLGGPNDDLLGWIGTENSAADWLPEPYKQTFTVTALPGGKLVAEAPLQQGRRTWAFLIAKGADFPEMPPGTPGNPGKDLYRWWTKHIVVSLDKVVNWELVWPDMEKIEFPHTYFSANDLPGIRARLQTEPAIKTYMEALRKSDGGYFGWGHRANDAALSPNADLKARFEQYRAKYRERGGIAQGIAYISAGYLYYGDRVYLEQLDDRQGVGDQTPREYLDFFIKCYLDGAGPLWREGSGGDGGQMGSMNVSDQMLLRCVGFELLLGSDILSPAEKRDMLTKLAFMTYVMHDPTWQPPVHMPDGSQPAGYGQGTPNQKHCAFSVRAMTACMLTNHPMKGDWLRFAMAEVRPHYRYTIHDSGALLESPFYSSRDTMRYAPFWSALVRAGVAEVAPDYAEWMNRPKKAFHYLADMLTPKDPRMGGKRTYHPIGRSAPGVVDPTFMIGADPWGLDDPFHAGLMRWAWEQQGKPSPDNMGSTGGRNIALTLIAFGHPSKPLKTTPLHSRRYEGMGSIFRSHPEGDYESNVLFRHDGFCWDLYPVNNGAVYFYGKGAPLLPRFGGYWSHSYGGAWMMDMPFGNRIDFAAGNNNCFGSVTAFAALGPVADYTAGITDDTHWRRGVLFAKDETRDDPVYLLVRDDVSRPEVATSLHWWIMSRTVAPDGLTKPGVVPIKISHDDWVRNMGKNWANALKSAPTTPPPTDPDAAPAEPAPPATVPVLKGQTHHFPGMCGVDVDLFIAAPADPQILTDAASTGKFPYCQNPELYETQQLVRISQPAGKPYLTLITPRWPTSETPTYRTIADGAGVAISAKGREDRLFLAAEKVTFADAVVDIRAAGGFVRVGGALPLRLMVVNGVITAGGVTLTSAGAAALAYDGKTFTLYTPKGVTADVKTAPALGKVMVRRVEGEG